MYARKKEKNSVGFSDLIATRDAVIRACSLETCHEEAKPFYDMAQRLARVWGSDAVAIMLFVGEDWARGRKGWFPVFVRKTQFAPGYQRYLMMFQPRSRILCDFTVDFCVGGKAMYDPEEQEPSLRDLLAEPTLHQRLAAGMTNFGMKMSVDSLIDLFKEAFSEGRKFDLMSLFPPDT